MKRLDKKLRKLLDLTKTEADILNELYGHEYLCVKDLIKSMGKDRTTIQKCLIRLLKKELIYKKQVNLDRGFMFNYYAHGKDLLRARGLSVLGELSYDLEIWYKYKNVKSK